MPQLLIALLLAQWFTDSRLRIRFQGGFKVLIFMPNTITAATIAILFYALFTYPIAPVNTLLQQLGFMPTCPIFPFSIFLTRSDFLFAVVDVVR